MLFFRRKILISDTILFFFFTALLFLFVHWTADLGPFKWRILLFGSGTFLLYSLLTSAIIHRLSRPLQQIIDAISPIEEGKILPHISLDHSVVNGEFSALATLLNSLTDRIQKQIQRLKQQRQETEEILQSLGEGVIAVDTRGNVTFANMAACKMLGITLDAMLGHAFDEIHADQQELSFQCHEVVQQVLQTFEAVEQMWENRQAGRIYLKIAAVPRIGHNGAIVVIQDKSSDFKVLEMGKDFIANASHELRTPITIIRGFAETVQDHPNLSPEILREITAKIVRTSGRLDRLIQSLLTLADIEHLSSERFQTVDVVSLAEQCKYMLLSVTPHAHVKLTTDLSRATVIADPLLLDLAIMNLLENAVKYSSGIAQVELSVHLVDSEVQIEVKDQGIGIPMEDLPHIFDRFYTVDKARSRKSGGAGLGLSIVKTIIKKHSGRVTAFSELGKGSAFILSLPKA